MRFSNQPIMFEQPNAYNHTDTGQALQLTITLNIRMGEMYKPSDFNGGMDDAGLSVADLLNRVCTESGGRHLVSCCLVDEFRGDQSD